VPADSASRRARLTRQPVLIEVRDLEKSFRIPDRKVDTLKERVAHPFRRVDFRELRALSGISFDVHKGEFFGIVGRNGSGKSTLLKVLASIYKADAGTIRMAGRLAPFIELGVGFNAELTARENVELNSVMMGLGRRGAKRRLDSVLEFAELEEFVDLKLKNYSSGMMVRLAFAVMVEADADVMLVDEVLAVGDAAFQKKCLGRMSEVAREGRTVLFVSHNLPSIEKLSQRVIVVDGGRLVMQGDPVTCIAAYLGSHSEASVGVDLAAVPRLDPRLVPVYTQLELRDTDGTPVSAVGSGEALEFHLSYEAEREIANPSFGIIVSNGMGMPLFFLQTRTQHGLWERAPRQGRVVCRLDQVPLVPGEYLLTIGCMTGERQLDLLEHVASFSVEPRDFFSSGYLPPQLNGPVLVRSEWDLHESQARHEAPRLEANAHA